MTTTLTDSLERPLRDLRISLTDRCNFRCSYCMPAETFGKGYRFLPRKELLSFEEITRVVGLLQELGLQKVRLTGGEPLLRHDCSTLVGMLARPGLDLAMTSNGLLLPRHAEQLKRQGLQRVTVSLDSLRDEVFQRINDVGVPVSHVLEGIRAAEEAGLGPVKINMVVKRGLNEEDLLPLAEHCRETGRTLRFIEFMDVGNSNGWNRESVVPSAEILERLQKRWPLEAVGAAYRGEVARRWKYRDGAGEIGLISSVSQAFCGDCTRLRLSAEGVLYTCLFATRGSNLKTPLRAGADDGKLRELLQGLWSRRSDRYSERRGSAGQGQRIEMSYIGG